MLLRFYFISSVHVLSYLKFSGGTVDIGDTELDVDETVELVDSSGMHIREKMVYMSMDEANQSQDDISKSCSCRLKMFVPNLSVSVDMFVVLSNRCG